MVLIDDGSGDPQLTEYLAGLQQDPRIVTGSLPGNMGISHASNRAVSLATGEFVALLDQDDMLDHRALALVTSEIRAHAGVDLIYTDRVTISTGGRPVELFRKPDWSPERLRANMYVAHLTVLRRERVLEVGGFDPQLDGAQDHDLVLRVTERGGGVVHIPEVLYKWRQSKTSTASNPRNKPQAAAAGLDAVARHLRRTNTPAVAEPSRFPGVYRVERQPAAQPLTVLVTGSLDRPGSVWLDQAEEEMGHVQIIEDGAGEGAHPDGMNAGQRSAHRGLGQYLAGLAEDVPDGVVLILDPGMRATWSALSQLVAAAQEPDVGVAAARLVRPSGKVESAGLAVKGGRVIVLGSGVRRNAPGPFAANLIDREVSGVVLSGCAIPTRSLRTLADLPRTADPCAAGLVLANALWAQGQRVLQVNTADVVTSTPLAKPTRVPDEWLRPALNAGGNDRFSDLTPPRSFASRVSHRLRQPASTRGTRLPAGSTD
jgi:hypothetical protein